MYLVCLSSANCLRAFLCIIFRRGFLLGRQPCRPIWCSVWRMVWALTEWPPTPPPPPPFNLCSNAGSTHTSISQTQPLDMTLSTCTQLLWSTMARPVLSGSCPVLRHLYVEQQFFFSDPQRVLCHEVPCWTFSDQYERVTPAPHSHLRPCNTKESHDTGERKWLIGPTSCTLTTLHCSKVSFLQRCHVKRYNKIFTKM